MMRVSMARGAVSREAQKRARGEKAGVLADVRRADLCRLVALFALQAPMPSGQGEARHAMIEGSSVEPDEVEVPAVVLFVAADTCALRELRV